jgi:hypothetical protein
MTAVNYYVRSAYQTLIGLQNEFLAFPGYGKYRVLEFVFFFLNYVADRIKRLIMVRQRLMHRLVSTFINFLC